MQNYVKASTNNIVFSYDCIKQRYTSEFSITNILQDNQTITKLYINSYTLFSVNPIVVYTNPGETKTIIIERTVDNIDHNKQDKIRTYTLKLNTPVSSYEEAKSVFKASNYRTEGQKIEYTTQYLTRDSISFHSFDITKDTKKGDSIEEIKREIDNAQKKISEKEKSIKELEQKIKSNCQSNSKGIVNDNVKSQPKQRMGSYKISLATLVGLFLFFFVFGASLNKRNRSYIN